MMCFYWLRAFPLCILSLLHGWLIFPTGQGVSQGSRGEMGDHAGGHQGWWPRVRMRARTGIVGEERTPRPLRWWSYRRPGREREAGGAAWLIQWVTYWLADWQANRQNKESVGSQLHATASRHPCSSEVHQRPGWVISHVVLTSPPSCSTSTWGMERGWRRGGREDGLKSRWNENTFFCLLQEFKF